MVDRSNKGDVAAGQVIDIALRFAKTIEIANRDNPISNKEK